MDPYGLFRLCLIPSGARATGAAPASAAGAINASTHIREKDPLKCVGIGDVGVLSRTVCVFDYGVVHPY